MDLPDLIRQLIATPGSAVRREMLGEFASWGAHEENTARLLEAQSYYLDWQWAQAITDPDDPDVKRERAEAKRNGIKPPDRPMIPPIANRPAGIAEQRLNEYLEQVKKHSTPKKVRQSISREQFDKQWGLDS